MISAELQNHWLWTDKPFAKGQAWIDLLIMASDKETYYRGKIYSFPQGQLITSETILSKRWGWSRTKIRSFLHSLAESSMISIEADKGKSVITIPQYTATTLQNTTAKQKVIPKKKQVERQDKATGNECSPDIEEQEEKQVKIQEENKISNETNSEKRPQIMQLSILDAIKENNYEGNQSIQQTLYD